MQVVTAVAVMPQRTARSAVLVFGLILAFLMSAVLGYASPVRGVSGGVTASATAADAPAKLKAVIIVGPTHGFTTSFLERGEVLAKSAESYGMDVRRVFHPNATAEKVLANIQGANIVAYIGHGNGWPSPYGPFQENTKNGFGLNPFAGGSASNVQYYGAKWIRQNVVLAPNAVTLLNGLCYAAGNGESGMAIPSWDIARQRVDNFAAGFLTVGAKGVFAYSWQSGSAVIKMLHTTNKTFGEMFTTAGAHPHPSYGFIGWDARKFASERTPGATNYLDPHAKEGFLRAFSGDLSVTASEWAAGAGSDPGTGGGDPDPTPTPTPTPSPSPTPPASTDTTPPSVPQNLAATALGFRRVALTWQASTDNSGGPLKYKLFRNGALVGSTTSTSLVDRPDLPGTYKYKVRAVDPSKNKSALSAVAYGDAVKGELVSGSPVAAPDTTPPSVPKGLTATVDGDGRVSLTWKPSTDNVPGTLWYRVFRNGVRIGSVTSTSFTDRPGSDGTYKYKLRAVDTAGNVSALTTAVFVTVDD